MSVFKPGFISRMICKLPGLRDLTDAIIYLASTLQEICIAIAQATEERRAHEEAILDLYERQSVLFGMVTGEGPDDEEEFDEPAPSDQKEHKPN